MANPVNVKLISLNNDMTFVAKSNSGHFTLFDAKEEVGGNGAAATPIEIVLEALGGCQGMDTLAILKKKRISFAHLDIELKGERAEEHPKVYTDIHMVFTLYSNDGDKALKSLERAIQLSNDKYCSVAAMLKGNVNITFEAQVLPE
ncbi:MAG: OsmC family protein [Candidatus Neomarinimicrobiota bacterium]|jgi:putative redox protein